MQTGMGAVTGMGVPTLIEAHCKISTANFVWAHNLFIYKNYQYILSFKFYFKITYVQTVVMDISIQTSMNMLGLNSLFSRSLERMFHFHVLSYLATAKLKFAYLHKKWSPIDH